MHRVTAKLTVESNQKQEKSNLHNEHFSMKFQQAFVMLHNFFLRYLKNIRFQQERFDYITATTPLPMYFKKQRQKSINLCITK